MIEELVYVREGYYLKTGSYLLWISYGEDWDFLDAVMPDSWMMLYNEVV